MPTTALGALSVPTTGTEVGTWGSGSVNPNMVALDGYGRGVQTISLAAATTFTLGAPSGSITPGTGPTQAQNAVLKFSGTLSGNAVITLPLPGYYIIQNDCVVGTNYIQLRGVGTGNLVGAPPGGAWHVYNDGTNVAYANMGHVGSFLDLAVSTTPAWMTACTVRPYLLTDGSVYSTSTYPSLGAALGSTFGGNGASTFGVPDQRNRFRAPLATGGGQRITTGVSGVDGATINSAGGGQSVNIQQSNLPNVNFNVSGTDHSHSVSGGIFGGSTASALGNTGLQAAPGPSSNITIATATINMTVNSGGSGNAVVSLSPTLIFGLTFIKT